MHHTWLANCLVPNCHFFCNATHSRNVLQLHYVHGRLVGRADGCRTELPSPDRRYPRDASLGEWSHALQRDQDVSCSFSLLFSTADQIRFPPVASVDTADGSTGAKDHAQNHHPEQPDEGAGAEGAILEIAASERAGYR